MAASFVHYEGKDEPQKFQALPAGPREVIEAKSIQEMLIIRARQAERSRKATGTFSGYYFHERSVEPDAAYSFQDLHVNAKHFAAELIERGLEPGDRVALMYPPCMDFIPAMWGCLYAGLVPVPLAPLNIMKLSVTVLEGFRYLLETCGANVIITNGQYRKMYKLAQAKSTATREKYRRLFPAVKWIVSELIPGAASKSDRLTQILDKDIFHPASRGEMAYLQFTSGSTSRPKGVIVTHSNVISQLRGISVSEVGPPLRVAHLWAPFYHDMGLISSVFGVLAGYTCETMHLMTPLGFLRNPMVSLKILSKFKVEITVQNNFALEHYMRYASQTNIDLSTLNFSNLRHFWLGGDFVYPDTLRRFYNTFKECGLRDYVLQSTWGQAESTLVMVSVYGLEKTKILEICNEAYRSGEVLPLAEYDCTSVPEKSVGLALASAGVPIRLPGYTVVVVDPDSKEPLPEDRIGEFWVSGPSLCNEGYWQNAEKTESTFRARLSGYAGPFANENWLRTGDAGFIHKGTVYLASRLSDVIVMHGTNHFPSDIEPEIESCHRALRKGNSVIFAVTGSEYQMRDEKAKLPPLGTGGQLVVVVAELRKKDDLVKAAAGESAGNMKEFLGAAFRAAFAAVSSAASISPDVVVFTKPGVILKTSSGKKRRSAMKKVFLAGKLPSIIDRKTRDELGKSNPPPMLGAAKAIEEEGGQWRTSHSSLTRAAITGSPKLERNCTEISSRPFGTRTGSSFSSPGLPGRHRRAVGADDSDPLRRITEALEDFMSVFRTSVAELEDTVGSDEGAEILKKLKAGGSVMEEKTTSALHDASAEWSALSAAGSGPGTSNPRHGRRNESNTLVKEVYGDLERLLRKLEAHDRTLSSESLTNAVPDSSGDSELRATVTEALRRELEKFVPQDFALNSNLMEMEFSRFPMSSVDAVVLTGNLQNELGVYIPSSIMMLCERPVDVVEKIVEQESTKVGTSRENKAPSPFGPKAASPNTSDTSVSKSPRTAGLVRSDGMQRGHSMEQMVHKRPVSTGQNRSTMTRSPRRERNNKSRSRSPSRNRSLLSFGGSRTSMKG